MFPLTHHRAAAAARALTPLAGQPGAYPFALGSWPNTRIARRFKARGRGTGSPQCCVPSQCDTVMDERMSRSTHISEAVILYTVQELVYFLRRRKSLRVRSPVLPLPILIPSTL